MKSLMDDRIRSARILLTLGHSYVPASSSSSENSEDEEEGEEEESVRKEEKKGKKKKKNQRNESEKNTDALKKVLFQFNENMQCFNEEETQVQLDSELQDINKKNHSEFDKETQTNVLKQNEQDKLKKTEGDSGTKLDSEMKDELEFQQKFYEKVQAKQKLLKNNVELELGKNMQTNTTFQQELEENQPTSDKYIELQLNIEVPSESELQQELDKDIVKQLFDEGIEIELSIELVGNSEFQQQMNESVQDGFNCIKQQMLDRGTDINEQFNSNFQQDLDKNVKYSVMKKNKKVFKQKNLEWVNTRIDIILQKIDNKLHSKFDSVKYPDPEGITQNKVIMGSMQHKIKSPILLETNSNGECYENKPVVQQSMFNKEISSKIQQELPGKVLDKFGKKTSDK